MEIIEQLIELALAETPNRFGDRFWADVLKDLDEKDDVFAAALDLIESSDTARRVLGVEILCGLHMESKNTDGVVYELLEKLAKRETEPDVIRAIATHVYLIDDPRTCSFLSRLSHHLDPEVRRLAAFNMSLFSECLDRLLELTRDEAPVVREYATFALDHVELDTPEMREAFWERIDDDIDEVRWEAEKALAHRRDPVFRQKLVRLLRAQKDVQIYMLNLAEWSGDPAYYGALSALAIEEVEDANDEFELALERALQKCGPAASQECNKLL